MASSELIVGLDIGTTKICAVVGEQTDDGINIIGIGTSPSTGLHKGVVVNIDQTVQSIAKAVDEAKNMAGCDIRTVYAGIAGSHIQGINSHGVINVSGGDEITQSDVDRVLDIAKNVRIPSERKILHVLPKGYILDDQSGIDDPIGMSGMRLEADVHIVTGAVASAQNIIRACNKCGLEVEDIVLESLASSKSILTDDEKEIGVAIVDIGGGSSDIAIFSGKAISYTGAVALGGNDITHDISRGLRTSQGSAEAIKIKHGCALSALVGQDEKINVPSVGGRPDQSCDRSLLASICEARMEEILANIYVHHLDRSGLKDQLAAGIVLTGGASLMPGTVELAEAIFQMPVRMGKPRRVGGLTDTVDTPRFATAVGLLFYGAENDAYAASSESADYVEHWWTPRSIFRRMKNWFSDVR